MNEPTPFRPRAVFESRRSPASSEYAAWIAVGALIGGALATLVYAQRVFTRQPRRTRRTLEGPAATTPTPPHGDILPRTL